MKGLMGRRRTNKKQTNDISVAINSHMGGKISKAITAYLNHVIETKRYVQINITDGHWLLSTHKDEPW